MNLDANITEGACSEELEIPKCGITACTKEYEPFCACPPNNSDPALCKTYGNNCTLTDANNCGEVSQGRFGYQKHADIVLKIVVLPIQMQLSMKENVHQRVVKRLVPRSTTHSVLVHRTLLIHRYASNIRTNAD